jgi:glycosyltransferase involved in cell wall biosynthesis
MKVLHTLDSLNRGGTETLVLDICRNAKRFGFDMTFVATGSGEMEKEFENSGVNFIRLERKMPVDLNLIWQLRKIIKEKEIEIVHGYQAVELLHLYLATLGLKNVKCIQTHEGFIEGNKNRLVARYLSPLVDANISVSRALFSWIREELGIDTSKNFYLVYNAIDEKRLVTGNKLLKTELGFDEDSLLLGMVANFRADPTKDQMTVCRALPQIFEEFKDANFIFVGNVSEGGEDNYYDCIKLCDETGIGDRVFFLGGRDDIPDILEALDLFVFSSLKEGLSLSLAEAMLKKVPLIISDIPPLTEATNNGKYAEVFQTKNATDLAEKAIKLLKDKDLREEKTDKAYHYARQNFSIEAHFRTLKTLYSGLIDKTRVAEDSKTNDKSEDKQTSEETDTIFGLD